MKFLIVSVVLFAAAVTASLFPKPPITTIKDLPATEFGSRIISGKPAKPGQFSWQVANRFGSGARRSFCGGALICDRWVLTAAHCAIGATDFTLYLGSVNQSQAVEVGRVVLDSKDAIVHEQYNPFTLNNDIALIKLPKSVNFTDRIKPIPLSRNHTGVNETLTVSGWGKTSDASNAVSPVLNYVELNTISNKECEGVYGSLVVKNGTLCCRGKPEHSTCNGDSGGPLVGKNNNGNIVHMGVVSFVHSAGCASGNPSGYIRTEFYIDWIEKNINGTCQLPK